MRFARKDSTLNDAIDYLDEVYRRAGDNVRVAIGMLNESELAFIYDETASCLDLRYYLENYHGIRDENGNWKAFYPWFEYQEILYSAIQEEWDEYGFCKIICLKPRQSGISTWTAAAMFHKTIFTPHSYSMIVGQNGETAEHLYNMSLNAYHALPWWMKPEYLYKTKGDEIEFQRADDAERSRNPGLGSILKCSNAQKMSGVAIGRSLRNLHGSEVSRWSDDGLFEADIKPSMNARDTFAILESTGYGRQGFFYDHWRGSVEGDTGYRAVFIPVYRARKYYLPFSRKNETRATELRNAFELDKNEEKFTARVEKEEHFSIPKEFWNFYRTGMRAAKRAKARAGFVESYPLTPQDAFQASGLCAFDREMLAEQTLRYVCKPLYAGEIALAFDNRTPNTDMIREVDDDEILPSRKGVNPSKRFWIWLMPEPGRTYYVGSDTGLGVPDGDFSVVQVFMAGEGTAPDEQVAEWWGRCPPAEFARINMAIAYWYNGAEIATEYQGPGISTGDKLVELDYPTLYRERMKDRPGGAYKPYFHFVTNIKTRDAIIATMNESMLVHNRQDEPGVILHSEDLLDEMQDFGSLGGRFEGQGNHDDGCFPPESQVNTPYGPTPIKDVTNGSMVLSHDGKEHEVLWIGYRMVAEDLQRLTLFGLDRPLECTQNHPVWSKRKRWQCPPVKLEDAKWTPAKDIRKNDFVYIPCRDLPQTAWSDDMLYLFGWYLADGYASMRDSAMTFTLGPDDDHSRLVDILERLVRENPTTTLRGQGKKNGNGKFTFKHLVIVKDFGKYKRVCVGNQWLNKLLHDTCGKPHAKFIHPSILNTKGTLTFVRAFLEGDGSQTCKRQAVTVCQKNHSIIEGMQRILIDHGIWASIQPKINKHGQKVLFISGGEVNRFLDATPAFTPSKFRHVPRKLDHPVARWDGTGFWAQVKAVSRSSWVGPVWNMEVADTNSYLVNGVAVHNCMSAQITLYCMTETTVHLKGTANDRSTEGHVDDIREYGVFDHLNRQRGMYRDKSIAEGMIVGRPGWSVQPVLICKANTLWSPIHDDPKSPEYRLRHQYGMESDEITPQLVSTFREAYRQVSAGSSQDPDW